MASRDPIAALRRRLLALAFVDEFGPVYAVYTLWFNDNGISTSQVSTVFLVWAVVTLVLEVPSGALADRVDRRRLLAAAFGLRAAGIALWLVWPTLTGVVIGAVLWAVHDALASGTWEALIHDELTALGAGDRYAPVIARVEQAGNLGIAAGTVLGAVLLQLGVGLTTLGWLTVAVHGSSIAMVLALADVRWVSRPAADGVVVAGGPHASRPGVVSVPTEASETSSLQAWWTTLRSGVREARTVPVARRLLIVGALLEGLFLIDEYVPLLSRDRGGGDAAAPILVLVVWIGLLVGDEIAARRPALSGRVLGAAMVAAMSVTSVAFLGDAVWMLGLVAVGYAVLEVVWISSDARLQAAVSHATRATVTSVRGLGSSIVSITMFAVIGVMADGDDPTPGLLVMVAALAATGLLVMAWLPAGTTDDEAPANTLEPRS